MLLEAHAPEAFLERVKALEQGEIARLEGGVAVKRLALEDGRDAFRVAEPSSYARAEPSWDNYGRILRSAEEAVREAFRQSAGSSDPDSIGGVTRLSRWAPLEGPDSAEVRVQDFTLDGKVIVSAPGLPGATRTVMPDSLRRKPQVFAALAEEAGTNWKQVQGDARKRINSIVKHYAGMAHPFTQCVADNTKRFGPERAKRVCAVVKDMGRQSTKWRKGKVAEAQLSAWTDRLLEAAGGDVDGLEAMMLAYVMEAGRVIDPQGGDPIELGVPDWWLALRRPV